MNQEAFTKPVLLKVLYTFDDKTSFLARSSSPIQSRILTLPGGEQQIGCTELKRCIGLVQFSSPEFFQKNLDYSIYYKDIMEHGQPYVGYGLCSKVLKDKKLNTMVTGRVSTNFMSILNNNDVSDTLEITLRFCQINNGNNNGSSKRRLPSSPIYETQSSSSPPLVNSDEFNEPMLKRRQQRKQISAPIMASRTQSLPFFDENSLAHKIRLADMNSNPSQLNSRDVSSRFAILPKDQDAPPTKAKKTKSFIQSVVKIGDTTIKKPVGKKCINCSLTNQPPYKYHKEGIFQFGNSGYLCSICTQFQNQNDIKQLRERGNMGANGLLEGPYSKPQRKKKKLTDSSPAMTTSSSPVMLQTGFKKSKSNSMSNTNASGSVSTSTSNNKVINNFPLLNSSKTNTPSHDLFDMTNILNLERDLDPTSSDSFDHPNFRLPIDSGPLGATKLNTILIPFDDDDDEGPNNNGNNKENQYPKQKPSMNNNNNNSNNHNHNLLGAEISPSIQRIIESFTNNEPSSPTKTGGEWNYDFFNENQIGDGDEDEEMDRILNSKTPIPLNDVTPKDADTVQTANDDSPNAFKPPIPNSIPTNRSKVNMPSSPFFSIPEHNEDDVETRDTTVRSPINWDRSSPVTDPSSILKDGM